MIIANTSTTGNVEVLQAALTYAGYGWCLLPVWRPVDDRCSCRRGGRCGEPGKHPRNRHGWKGASSVPKKLREWFSGKATGSNIALATGAISGVVALDIDEDGNAQLSELEAKLGKLPSTVTAASGRGFHLYFRAEENLLNSKNRVWPGIDFRGEAGYLILPPSLHVCGKLYQWICAPETTDIAPLPKKWLAELRSLTGTSVRFLNSHPTAGGQLGGTEGTWRHMAAHGGQSPPVSLDRASAATKKQIDAIVARHALTAIGTRNRTAFDMARALLGVPGIASLAADAPERRQLLLEAFDAWYELSKGFTRTPYEAARQKFLEAVRCVKVPGSKGPLDAAWELSARIEPPTMPDGTILISAEARRLASFIVAISQITGQRDFFLSGEEVAKRLNLSGSHAPRNGRRLLESFCECQFIEKTTSGGRDERGKLTANTYRFVDPPQLHDRSK
jgi:hypothetical protein